MKLPFNKILRPMLKPYLSHTKLFCSYPTFSFSLPYTYVYSILGVCLSARRLKERIGKVPFTNQEIISGTHHRRMIVHDLEIIATSLGFVQYTSLLFGCLTENPALFLPHLTGQILILVVKVLNTFMFLIEVNFKSLNKLRQNVTAILLMTFNWLQEFCVFRQYLCLCDL
nr:uncharacterized protein LOC116775596 [Danaus plexippus plexippus]